MTRYTQLFKAIVCDMPTHFSAKAPVLLALCLALTCYALPNPMVNHSTSVASSKVGGLDAVIPHCKLISLLFLSVLSDQLAQGVLEQNQARSTFLPR